MTTPIAAAEISMGIIYCVTEIRCCKLMLLKCFAYCYLSDKIIAIQTLYLVKSIYHMPCCIFIQAPTLKIRHLVKINMRTFFMRCYLRILLNINIYLTNRNIVNPHIRVCW